MSLSVLGPEDDPVSSPSDISQDDVDIERLDKEIELYPLIA